MPRRPLDYMLAPSRFLFLHATPDEQDRILEGIGVMLTQESCVPDDCEYDPSIDAAPFCWNCDALKPSWDSACACDRGASYYQDDEYR